MPDGLPRLCDGQVPQVAVPIGILRSAHVLSRMRSDCSSAAHLGLSSCSSGSMIMSSSSTCPPC